MGKWLVIVLLLLIPFAKTVYAGSTPIKSGSTLDDINQRVCSRFEDDTVRMAGIMDELRRRKGITETRVAFGGIDTPIKRADYWVTYAAEAIAFQRAQKYSSKVALKNSLEILKNKILQAKAEVKNTLNE